MLAWVVTFRPTLRRSSLLPFPKSLPLNSLDDPHPLTPVPSILYKKHGGGGGVGTLPPIFRTLFQVSYPVSPLFAAFTKTAGVWGYSSYFGTVHASSTFKHSEVRTFQRVPVYPLSFQILVHSFALSCTHQTRDLFVFSYFRTLCQKPPGVGVLQRSNRSSTAVAERRSRPGRDDPPIRPIAAKRLWCNNPQRHEKSSRSGETTPLPPVSKNKRADIGNSLILVPFASRAWVQRSKVGPQQGGPQHRIR